MTTVPVPKPRGVLKWGYTLPIFLYRWHLGWLLGHRFLMVTHRGRKSGKLRRTVLEVAHYDPVTRECIVEAAYGSQSDWYQNIHVHPALLEQIGRQRYTPYQRDVSHEESLAILREYQQKHPWLFRQFTRLFRFPYNGTDESLRTLTQTMPAVAFRPAPPE